MTHRLRAVLSALFGALMFALPAMVLAGEGRVALVIGNEAYEHAPPLATPVRDAQAMARSLRDLGFDVTVLTDAGPDVFTAVLDTFARKAEGAGTVLFYYSGHAFQTGGINRLVPVSARLDDPAALGAQTIALDEIARRLKPADGQLLLFLDACRTNPLPQEAAGAAGLAQYDGGTGTFVAFATAPGAVAWDKGADGENSPFTGALLGHIATAGQSLSDLMIAVRNDVSDQTGGKQIPWEQSSLRSQFYFRPDTNLADGTTATVITGAALPSFDTVESDSFLMDDSALAENGKAVDLQGNGSAIRLAALSSDTRSLETFAASPPAPDRPRITGTDAAPEGTALPDNLAEGVQDQLKRIGCYTRKVDGQWGDGSRAALQDYYDAIKSDSTGTEPTAELYLALTKAEEGTCKPAPVAAKAKPAAPKSSGTTKKAATTTKKSTTTQKAAPAPAPEKKSGTKCKFLVVAIVCS